MIVEWWEPWLAKIGILAVLSMLGYEVWRCLHGPGCPKDGETCLDSKAAIVSEDDLSNGC